MSQATQNLLYLVTIICFILALRFLSSPKNARKGNWVGAIIGSVFGAVGARRVKMTAMPQMVALFNGVGGGAAALVSLAEFHNLAPEPGRLHVDVAAAIALSALIGSVSFAGSMIAFSKLQELIQGRPIVFPGQNV